LPKRVLVSNLMMLKEKERFKDILKSHDIESIFTEIDQHLTKDQCLNFAGKIDGWLAGDDPGDEFVLSKMSPRLKIISKWGTGLDSFDLEAAKKLGIKITNTPHAFDEAVGEIAVGYILALTREIITTHIAVTSGDWPKRQQKSLSQLKIGLIGFGAIGQGIALRLSGFKTTVIYYDPVKSDNESFGAYPVSFNELNRTSDVILLCCNLNSTNQHLIDSSFLKNIKKGSYIVNLSRGGLIDQAALEKSLIEGNLAGAALDVFQIEPLPLNSKLRELNVIFGSHNANNTQKAVEFVHKNTLDNLFDNLES